MARSPK
jgi:hypothetical protein